MSGSSVDESFTKWGRKFPRKQVQNVLSAIVTASGTLKKKTYTDKENWLTRRLYTRLKQRYPFRDGPLDIDIQSEITNEDIDADRPAGQIDIKVTCCKGVQVYFAIEAKRLRVCDRFGSVETRSPQYVDDGMMRFITGQYAPLMNIGAMLGYVFDGHVATARDSISKTIEKRRNELRLRQGTGLRPSKIMPNRVVDETVHNPDKRELTLYHVLVAV